MRRTSQTFATVLVTIAIAALCACSSPEKELKEAKAAGTIAALDAFLAKHPQGPLADEAKLEKEKLELAAARTIGTVDAYQDFLKKHPQGAQADAARLAIEELHFAAAKGEGTFEAYERFVTQHPQGKLLAAARQAMDTLLPEAPLVSTVDVASTEPTLCTVHSRVMILHRGTGLGSEPPALAPGSMSCGNMLGKSTIELEQLTPQDPNHTVVLVKSASASGWSECRGTCTVRFTVLGQDRVVTATYR
jgi:hypothetical protein